MPRAATTTDAFNAIAEPRRRDILVLLANDERTVSEIVQRMRLPQPSVSKHLGVLRQVGLVKGRRRGREILYRTNPAKLKAVHEWTRFFEDHWKSQLQRIKERAERTAATTP